MDMVMLMLKYPIITLLLGAAAVRSSAAIQ
jgi:hypothetical protein